MLVIPTKKFKYAIDVSNTNMTEEQNLIKNIKIILNSANLVYSTRDYTSATILYFKAAFTVLDLVILKQQGYTPKDHTERFGILEKHFPNLYSFLDKYFEIYRQTYSLTIKKEICEEIKENVARIVKEHQIQV